MAMVKNKTLNKMGRYALKAAYPLLGAFPERAQDWLEEKFESYDKFEATDVSAWAEAGMGMLTGTVLPLMYMSSGLWLPFYASLLAFYAGGEGAARAGAVERDEERKREVFGSAFIAIPSKPVYWAYDKIREKLEKKERRGD